MQAAAGHRFLVLDELHTYRGRQGADVDPLVRSVREATHATSLQCVGTSATVAGTGTPDEHRHEAAAITTRLVGSEVVPANVIGEKLHRARWLSDQARRLGFDEGFLPAGSKPDKGGR